MNLKTDQPQQKEVLAGRRKMTSEITRDLMKVKSDAITVPDSPTMLETPAALTSRCVSDEIPIRCIHLKFKYKTKPMGHVHPKSEWLIEANDLTVPQGSMVALVGSHKGAKTTFLKLISQ